ncbi:alpha/beta fold hydrolase [Actinomadura hibisca]|uniref:alpha/beta fold hydrolase n=1 Tax=Actinomadura hibisca TaxID=68565 RepID=UPI0008304665|nr:alpha/beta hydrolase [Actinomadura hibisca]
MTSSTLRVNGATLHYDVCGEGPLLLLIPGGTGGAASFDGVVDGLAVEYTVVTYDPRGMSRSVLDEAEAEQRVAEHADDTFRLLELLSPDEPVRVFGTSSGAIVALELLVTHPQRVERVVAHEPPVVEVLPDADEHRALLARVREAFDSGGPMQAMGVFAAGLQGDGPPAPQVELSPEAAARVQRSMVNMPYFIGRIVPGFMAYVPDVARLEALADRLVLAGGDDSRGQLPYRPAAFLAERLGTELVHFPGGHVGLSTHPDAFGEALRKVLVTPQAEFRSGVPRRSR